MHVHAPQHARATHRWSPKTSGGRPHTLATAPRRCRRDHASLQPHVQCHPPPRLHPCALSQPAHDTTTPEAPSLIGTRQARKLGTYCGLLSGAPLAAWSRTDVVARQVPQGGTPSTLHAPFVQVGGHRFHHAFDAASLHDSLGVRCNSHPGEEGMVLLYSHHHINTHEHRLTHQRSQLPDSTGCNTQPPAQPSSLRTPPSPPPRARSRQPLLSYSCALTTQRRHTTESSLARQHRRRLRQVNSGHVVPLTR